MSKKKGIITGSILLAGVIISISLFYLTKDKVSNVQIENQLSKTVQSNLGRVDGIDIMYDSKTGTALIVQTEQTEIPEVSAQNIRSAYVLLVRLGEHVLDTPEVKNIQVTEKVQLNFPKDPASEYLAENDKAGRPPVVTDVVTIAMSKDNFQAVKWQDYDGQPIDTLIKEKAYTYNIDATLKAQIRESELYLDL